MPIKNMTAAQIAEATRAQVTAGAKSTDRANRLDGETASEANARITAAYKELTAKPILTEEQITGGMKVQYVRTQAGGFGEYVAIKPIGYTGPTLVTNFTDGVLPEGSKYTTGSRVGLDSDNRTIDEYRKVLVGKLTAGNPLTDAEKAWLAGNSSNTQSSASDSTGVSGFKSVNGVFSYNGIPFTGINNGTNYVAGKPVAATDLKGAGTDDDPFTLNGEPFTGNLGGRSYSGGKITGAAPIVINSNNIGTGLTTSTGAPSSNVDILKALLKGAGYNAKIIDSSVSYLNSLIKDGLDYDNATEIFLNSKEYTLKNGTKVTSPFYTEYGYLNEGLVNSKTPTELYNAVEGYKGVVSKYAMSDKFLSQDALKGYVKNNVTVADLDARANLAKLKGINADPNQVTAMIKLGFIGSAADLTDFYMDSKIGKEQLELNKNTGAFVAEAIRRAQGGLGSGVDDLTRYKKLVAGLTAKGLSEAEITQIAGEGFQTIAEQLGQVTGLSQIYDKAGGTKESNAALQTQIQSELENEQYLNLASERRKRVVGMNAAAFSGTSGTTTSSLRTSGTSGIL
jgi:hypothetical protein